MTHSVKLKTLLEERLQEFGLSAFDLSNVLYEAMGCKSPSTARNYIYPFVRGELLRTARGDIAKHAKNLALVLYACDVPEDHDVVSTVRRRYHEHNVDFCYPPANGLSSSAVRSRYELLLINGAGI